MAALFLTILISIFSLSLGNFGTLPPLPSSGIRLYQGSSDAIIPDYAMIRDLNFNHENITGSDTNDGLWCQSSNNVSNIGTWYLPNGTAIPEESSDSLPVYVYRSNGQIGLLRNGELDTHQGLYTCVISDEFNTNQTLVVAIYRNTEFMNGIGPTIDGNITFSLTSSRDVSPPIFTLSFNVTLRPPTGITCTVNSTNSLTIRDIERRVINTTNLRVEVQVTLSTRDSGDYRCTVTNARVDNINVLPGVTNSQTITVSGAPYNLTVNRIGLTSVALTWSPPLPLSLSYNNLTGYQIFYDNGNTRHSTTVVGNQLGVSLLSLEVNVNYTLFVVGFGGGEIPSESSNVVTISTDIDFVLSSLPSSPLIGATDVTLKCQLSINVPGLSFKLILFDTEMNALTNETTLSSGNELTNGSAEIIFQSIDLTHGGQYTCMAVFPSSNVSQQYDLILQAPIPVVDINYNTGIVYESSSLVFTCIISSIFPGAVVNISWYEGTDRLLLNDNSITISNTTQLNDTVYSSVLNITSISLSMNSTVYTCSYYIRAPQYVTPAIGNISSNPIRIEVLNGLVITTSPNTTTTTTTTFGQQLTLLCSFPLNTIDVYDNISLVWSLQNNINNDDEHYLTGTSVYTNSTTIINTLVLSLLSIQDLGVYVCTVNVLINEQVVAFNRDTYTLNISVPQPNITVYPSTNNDQLIEGTYLDIICTSSNINPLLNITVTWTHNDTPIYNGSDYIMRQETNGTYILTINQLSIARDNNTVYTCVLTVPGSTFISGNTNSASISPLSVTEFDINEHTTLVMNFSNNNPFLGNLFTILCIATLPERYTTSPSVLVLTLGSNTLEFSQGNMIVHPFTRNSNVYTRNVTFNPLSNSDANNNYNCKLKISGSSEAKNSQSRRITAQLPPPSLSSITAMPSSSVYESTTITLQCIVTFINAEDLSVFDHGHWLSPNGFMIFNFGRHRVSQSSAASNTYINTLIINPVDNGDNSVFNDSGNYTYVAVPFSDDVTIPDTDNRVSIVIEIMDLPPLEVYIDSSNSTTYGHNLTLSCTVISIQGINVTINWIYNQQSLASSHTIEGGSNVLTLTLSNLIYEMNGVYTCIANYSVSQTNDASKMEEHYTLNVSSLGLPENFELSKVTPFMMEFTWLPPSEEYGPISHYLIRIRFDNRPENVTRSIDSTQRSFPLQGLNPYQLVEVSLSIVYNTFGGLLEGPFETLTQRTLQYESDPVTQLNVTTSNDNRAIVTWLPPDQPNGIIIHYRLILQEYMGSVIENVTVTCCTTATTGNLSSGIPYKVIMRPVNGAGNGIEEESDIFFSEQLVPSPVSDVTVQRINGTHARVNWNALTLRESRGFLNNYTVQYERLSNDRRRKRLVPQTIMVSSNETNVLLTDLHPTSLYIIRVYGSTSAGSGDGSQSNTVDRPETSNFQLRFSSGHSCENVKSLSEESIRSSIRTNLASTIDQQCSCTFQDVYISEDSILCDNRYPTNIFYRANITSFGSYNNTTLTNYIINWISTSPTLTTLSYSITIDSSCPVTYSNDDTLCDLEDPSKPPSLVIIIVIVIPIIVVLIILIVLVIVILTCCIKKGTKNKERLQMHLMMPNDYKDHKVNNVAETEFDDIEEEEDTNQPIYEPLDKDGNLMQKVVSRNKSASLPYNNLHNHSPGGREERSMSVILGGGRQLPLPPLPTSAPADTKDSPPIPPINGKFGSMDRSSSTQMPPRGSPPVSYKNDPISMSPSRIRGESPRGSSPLLSSRLSSLNETPEDTGAGAVVVAGGRADPKLRFSITSSANVPKNRVSGLTITSHTMSDHKASPMSPTFPGGSVSSFSSNSLSSSINPLSPEYAHVQNSPVYMNPADGGIQQLPMEDDYIQMKSPTYTEPTKPTTTTTTVPQSPLAKQTSIEDNDYAKPIKSTDMLPESIEQFFSPERFPESPKYSKSLQSSLSTSPPAQEYEVPVSSNSNTRESTPVPPTDDNPPPYYTKINKNIHLSAKRSTSPQEYEVPAVLSNSNTRESTPIPLMTENKDDDDDPHYTKVNKRVSAERSISPQEYEVPVNLTRESTPVPLTIENNKDDDDDPHYSKVNKRVSIERSTSPQDYEVPIRSNTLESLPATSTEDMPIKPPRDEEITAGFTSSTQLQELVDVTISTIEMSPPPHTFQPIVIPNIYEEDPSLDSSSSNDSQLKEPDYAELLHPTTNTTEKDNILKPISSVSASEVLYSEPLLVEKEIPLLPQEYETPIIASAQDYEVPIKLCDINPVEVNNKRSDQQDNKESDQKEQINNKGSDQQEQIDNKESDQQGQIDNKESDQQGQINNKGSNQDVEKQENNKESKQEPKLHEGSEKESAVES